MSMTEFYREASAGQLLILRGLHLRNADFSRQQRRTSTFCRLKSAFR